MKDMPCMCPAKTIYFSSDASATLLTVPLSTAPADALQQIGLTDYQAAILLHSGAAEVNLEQQYQLQPIFNVIARFANDHHVLVADGGTDTGGMQLMGEARKRIKGRFPLLGVAVTARVSYPGYTPSTQAHYPLSDGHSHFLLVEADEFGAESNLLVGLAQARKVPSAALIVNGGKIVEDESRQHAQNGIPIVALKGSLRFADDLADHMSTGAIRLTYLMGTKLRTFDVENQAPGQIYDVFKKLLFSATDAP